MTSASLFAHTVLDPTTFCLLWTRARTAGGYGQLCRNGKRIDAHRLAWQETHGPIPEGLVVMHRCDVKHCINPRHLRLGTPRDNTHDMVNKGRHRTNWTHSLSHEQRQEIRDLYARGEHSQMNLAQRFGVSQGTISNIVRRRYEGGER